MRIAARGGVTRLSYAPARFTRLARARGGIRRPERPRVDQERRIMPEDSARVAEQVEELKQRVVAMARLAQAGLNDALRGLIEWNHLVLDEVAVGDGRVNDLYIDI